MQSSTSLFFPPFQLDLTNEQLWREKRAVVLRAKTFAVLRYLVTHAGELVTKEDLLNAVWPNTSVSEGAVKICVQELRKALQDDSRRSQFIETVHRRGYRFIAPLTTSPTPVPSFKFPTSP
jgi:DNA-binding winged helix-turn-helix (wHTH) protein